MSSIAPGESSCLDASETESPEPTTVHRGRFAAETSAGERFRHSGWARNRSLVRESLARTHQPVNRIACWDSCGYQCYILQSAINPTVYKVAGSNCHDRFCVPCARLRSQCIANALMDHVGGTTVRLLTLTLRHQNMPLADTLDRLYDCFARLRRYKWWPTLVHGGAAFVELTWSPKTGHWHPHLHVLCTGGYLPHNRLKQAWLDVTGDSYIVDIRLARDKGAVLAYVTKYVTKSIGGSYVNRPYLLDEAVRALKGRKLCLTFGDWRGIQLTTVPADADWVNIGSYDSHMARALRGDADAVRIMEILSPVQLVLERDHHYTPPPAVVSLVAAATQLLLGYAS